MHVNIEGGVKVGSAAPKSGVEEIARLKRFMGLLIGELRHARCY